MVDVGHKQKTTRNAVASGRITMSAECYQAMKRGLLKKGDVLGVARVAGIMAAKHASSLIPLCHPLPIEHINVEFELDECGNSVLTRCAAKTTGATGVEMEALTGVSVALLTIYDMLKAIDKTMTITDIRLLEKSGGNSGDYCANNI
jgi:cyclic pyranopterin phosphate synthase